MHIPQSWCGQNKWLCSEDSPFTDYSNSLLLPVLASFARCEPVWLVLMIFVTQNGIWNVPGIPDSHPGDYPAYLYRLVTNIYSSVRPACSRLEFRGLPCSGTEAVRPNSFSWAKSEIFFFFRGALRPQKAYGLLGTAEEWNRECRELRPTSVFTQLQLARGQGSDRK